MPSSYLLAASPIHGHVGPVLRVGAHLVAQGHRVTMLTGSRFADLVTDHGMRHVALTGAADFDDRDPASYLPDRDQYRGVRQAQYDIRTIFVETIPDQVRHVDELVLDIGPDAVLADNAFAGVLPMIQRGGPRPPVAALGVTPLTQSSRVLGPQGLGLPPARSVLDRARYGAMGVVARRMIFRPTQQSARRAFAAAGAELDFFIMDASRKADRFLQLGPPGLEYERPDLARNTRVVGVLPDEPAESIDVPDWWDELDGRRPVVHVTQGTIDNQDFERLVRPSLEALADEEVTVVVTAGGRDPRDIGPVPDNARVARYLPYETFLPRVDVAVTNGGFGGVQSMLAAGVPLVVAGDTEDKPEVAARVAHSGAGLDLRTGTPTPEQVASAVRQVLGDDAFRARAQQLQKAAATIDALGVIESELRRLGGWRR